MGGQGNNMTSDADLSTRATSVFFSYSRDDQARAKPIIALIEAAGYPTWWDGLLEGGERYARATEEALDRAQAVVVLWSKTSAQSHWVHDEATRGRDRRILIPLSLDGTPPPLGFGQFQVIDISKARIALGDPQMDRMIRAVAALHNETAPSAPSAPIARGAGKAWLSRRSLVGGGIALAAAGGGAAAWLGGLFGKSTMANSVAVLPFANLSDDPAQRYFSEGLASEIRSQLSRNALLETAGLTSSNQFRDYAGDARSAARKLRVAYLLSGDVQKMGDQLKVSTFLVDGSSGTNIWSEVFEKKLSDVFSVQSEIAGAVTRQLTAAIDTKQTGQNKVQVGGTKSLAAFDAYLRGIDLFEAHIDEASERAALAKFDEAIASDARYAAARAARSKVLAIIANQYAGSAERRTLYAEAVAEAERATALAPDYAPAFVALGYAQFYGRLDARAARAPYDRAYALTRSEVDVISRYAVYCARTGRFVDADAAIARAAALDPLNSSMFKSAGNIKYAAGSYQEAIDFARQALVLSPKRSTLRGDMGNAYLMLGQLDAAEAEFAQESNTLLALPGRAIVAQRRGQAAAVQERLAELVATQGDNGLYQQAQILAQSGAKNAAFAALEKAYAARDSGLVYLLNDPFLAPLRSDARYNNLLRQLKFV
jgi:TolB-like protein